MARKRRELDGTKLAALVRAGRTAEEIVAAFAADGCVVSRATIARRMRELRGLVNAERAERTPRPRVASTSPAPELPEEPEAIPEGASVSQLDRWIRQAEAAIDAAEASGDHRTMGQMLRVAAALAETRRKAMPPPPADPNEHPDMVAAAERARELLHKLIESAVIG